MDGVSRREKIIQLLMNAEQAVSGGKLAKALHVSRQVIVQDIALLRATNNNIVSTTKGYLLYKTTNKKVTRCFAVCHTTEQIEDELCTIVDYGGKVLNVIVEHELYGQIETVLIVSNRQEVYEFVNKVKRKQTVPLKELTAGVHLHTVEAESEKILDRIEKELANKQYLIRT